MMANVIRGFIKKRVIYKLVAILALMVAAQLYIAYVSKSDTVDSHEIGSSLHKSRALDEDYKVERRHVLSQFHNDEQDSLKAPDVAAQTTPAVGVKSANHDLMIKVQRNAKQPDNLEKGLRNQLDRGPNQPDRGSNQPPRGPNVPHLHISNDGQAFDLQTKSALSQQVSSGGQNGHVVFENGERKKNQMPGQSNVKKTYLKNIYNEDTLDKNKPLDYNSNVQINQGMAETKKTYQWETYDYENPYNMLEIRVDRAPEHAEAQGQPWPMPQLYEPSPRLVVVDVERFTLTAPPDSCDRLKAAANRYQELIRSKVDLYIPDGKRYRAPNPAPGTNVISSLSLNLKRNCQDGCLPHEHMSEQYRLSIDGAAASLNAVEIWGAVRGLETFSQLIWFDPVRQQAVINMTIIKDYPRFRFRGLHIDTARHYIPVKYIHRLLDSMSYNKYNVLQWHITDDQSFPFVSKTFPLLHKMGAYSNAQIYSPQDVQALIQYAADRGIRVIPEFDLPGHTRSWGLGYPELLTNCSAEHHPFGAVNPINNYTYEFMQQFWAEVRQVFPDNYQHVGGDEINYKCWLRVKEIRNFMIKNNMTKDSFDYLTLDGDKLQGYFLKRLLDVMPKDRMKVAWEEAFNAAQFWNISTDQLIINVWKGGDYEWQYVMETVVRRGYKAILSAPWYLNYISYGIDWHKYYEQDPHTFLQYMSGGDKDQLKDQVIGGQVCLWSEFIDESNFESTLWPRAIAPAEKFWSSVDMRDWRQAQSRFEQHRCRMSRRGIHTSPNSGPGTCFGSMKIKPPFEPPNMY